MSFLKKHPLQGRTILITGASRGIGEALAREAVLRKAKLILVARDEARLQALSNELSSSPVNCDYVRCDLTKDAEIARLVERVGDLDVIIHNAASILYEPFAVSNESELRRIFELDYFSVLSLTRKLLPKLRKSGDAAVAVVLSGAVWHGLPLLGAYCAAKSALNGWAEALRLELKSSGIRVLQAYPGVTRTELSSRSPSTGPKPFSTTEGTLLSPAAVARKILDACEKGKNYEYVTAFNSFYRVLTALAPKFSEKLLHAHYRKKGWLP